jgi:uncharacterized protein YecE (DUF72 family)
MEEILRVIIGTIIFIPNKKPWIEKVNEIREQTKILRIYFNNHYGGKAVVNAMQFKEMIGLSLSADEKIVMENTKAHILGN